GERREARAEQQGADEDERRPSSSQRRRHEHGDLALGRRLAAGRRRKRLVVREDAPLELLQGGARLQTELLVEHPPRLPKHGESLCLAAAAVQRQRELGAEALAQGLLVDERLELGGEI